MLNIKRSGGIYTTAYEIGYHTVVNWRMNLHPTKLQKMDDKLALFFDLDLWCCSQYLVSYTLSKMLWSELVL